MVDQNSQFYAILTNVGAAKQANADALGIPWKITQMGVGDANGADPTPNATQTSLINEWRRAPLNQLKVDDKNSAIIVAEQVIPADVGGKWIREIALYDADGDMVAVANCAPTYKPLLSQGSGRTQVVRMNLIVSSASNVQLKIDPAVVLATREWVTEELARQDFKHSVQVATTAAITLSGLQTVDGVALQAGTRVLVKDQTAAKDNGLYLVAAGAWTRSSDADSDAKVTPGLLVLVEKGTANGDSAWQLVSDAPITVGVTAQIYEMAFGRTGVAAGIYRSVTVDKYGRVIAAANPTTVAGFGLTDVYTKAQIDQILALKAPLNSPAFTGAPLAPNATLGADTQQVANTAFVAASIRPLSERLATKADKADSLAGYGITDKVQKQAQPLIGAFTLECLDATDFGQINGILIKTRIPAHEFVMPSLTIKGGLGGYNEPFEMQLAWYFWEGAIYMPRMLVNGSTVGLDDGLKVYLSYPEGMINIRIDFGSTIYLPRLAVTAFKGKGYGGDYSMYEGWSSMPFTSAIAGEVPVKRTTVLNTANLPRNTGNIADSGWWRCADTGLIRQWGLTKGAASTTDYRTFPIAFPQRCVSLVATRTSVWYQDAATGTNSFVVSNSQFAVISGPFNSPDDIYWEAVGF